MEKKMWKAQPKGKGENKPSISILSILKILLAMYMVTGILLLILSAMLYRMQLSESVVSMGGFLSGKIMKQKRFLWGMAMGACYFLILMAGSIIFQQGINMEMSRFVTTLVLCTASGMIGGMAS